MVPRFLCREKHGHVYPHRETDNRVRIKSKETTIGVGAMIDGVSLHPLKQIHVQNGDLWHAFKATDEGFVGFGEAYITQVQPHTIKGWKRHNRYVLNLVVITGSVKFVIYDDRGSSTTKGQFQEIVLSPKDNYQRLTISPGLWVAFAGVDPIQSSLLIDFIPEVHNSSESDRKGLEEIEYDFNV